MTGDREGSRECGEEDKAETDNGLRVSLGPLPGDGDGRRAGSIGYDMLIGTLCMLVFVLL